MCLTLVLFASAGLYFTPTARINIDINPSFELEVNRFDKVISVNALNDDGKKLAETSDIKFAGYDEALCRILDYKSVETISNYCKRRYNKSFCSTEIVNKHS